MNCHTLCTLAPFSLVLRDGYCSETKRSGPTASVSLPGTEEVAGQGDDTDEEEEDFQKGEGEGEGEEGGDFLADFPDETFVSKFGSSLFSFRRSHTRYVDSNHWSRGHTLWLHFRSSNFCILGFGR